MHIYQTLINALSAHMIHINLNMIFYTHVEHSPTKTTHISPSLERVPLHLNCDLSLHLFPAQALLSSLLGSSPSVFWSACLALPVRGPDGCCLWDAQRWPGYPGDCASWSQWCKTLEMESCIFQSVLSQSDSKLSLLDNAHNIVLCYSLTLHLCSGSIVGWGVTYCWTV